MPEKKEEENGDIVIDLSIEDRDALVMIYIDKHFLEVSKQMFGKVLKQTGNIERALYDATLNEVTNMILSEKMEEEQLAAEQNQQEPFTNDE